MRDAAIAGPCLFASRARTLSSVCPKLALEAGTFVDQIGMSSLKPPRSEVSTKPIVDLLVGDVLSRAGMAASILARLLPRTLQSQETAVGIGG